MTLELRKGLQISASVRQVSAGASDFQIARGERGRKARAREATRRARARRGNGAAAFGTGGKDEIGKAAAQETGQDGSAEEKRKVTSAVNAIAALACERRDSVLRI